MVSPTPRSWAGNVRHAICSIRTDGGVGVTPIDVRNALAANNFTSAAGQVKGDFVQTTINAETALNNPVEFAKLVVATRGDALIRLGDFTSIELGAESADSSSVFDGLKAVFIGIFATPTSNPLTVIGDVRKAFPEIQRQLPVGMDAAIAYDATKFINASIAEVQLTLLEAALIVIVVIFLFLGNLRATLIPIVTIPLSLASGSRCWRWLLVNLLTLLALVLAIGLVVDDAIVVVENIYATWRRVCRRASGVHRWREIAVPVISRPSRWRRSMPHRLRSGLRARCSESLPHAGRRRGVSGVIALTLSPMMASKPCARSSRAAVSPLPRRTSKACGGATSGGSPARSSIGRSCSRSWPASWWRPPSCYHLAEELAPEEDQGILFNVVKHPFGELDYSSRPRRANRFSTRAGEGHVFIINGVGGDVRQAIAGSCSTVEERSAPEADPGKPAAQLAALPACRHLFPLPSLPVRRRRASVAVVIRHGRLSALPRSWRGAGEAQKSGLSSSPTRT